MAARNRELELSPSKRNVCIPCYDCHSWRNIIGPCWEYIITIMWNNKSNKVENDQNPYWLNVILCKYKRNLNQQGLYL